MERSLPDLPDLLEEMQSPGAGGWAFPGSAFLQVSQVSRVSSVPCNLILLVFLPLIFCFSLSCCFLVFRFRLRTTPEPKPNRKHQHQRILNPVPCPNHTHTHNLNPEPNPIHIPNANPAPIPNLKPNPNPHENHKHRRPEQAQLPPRLFISLSKKHRMKVVLAVSDLKEYRSFFWRMVAVECARERALSRGKVVVFEGEDGSGPTDCTWEVLVAQWGNRKRFRFALRHTHLPGSSCAQKKLAF